MKTTCSSCSMPLDRNGKYCKKCHAAYMRDWRKTHFMSPEQKKKDIARSYLGVYIRRGKINREPCEVCGSKAEAHHDDYSKPLQVKWLCRKHHMKLHAM